MTTKIKAGSQSPERAALAAAIERRGDLEREVGLLEDARNQNRTGRMQLQREADAARRELGQDDARSSDYLVDLALGRIAGDAAAQLSASQRLKSIEAAIEHSRSIDRALEGRIKDFDWRLKMASDSIRQRVAEALRTDPAVAVLLHEYGELRRRSLEMRFALDVIVRAGGLPASISSLDHVKEEGGARLATAWQNAVEALWRDPEKQFPKGEFAARMEAAD